MKFENFKQEFITKCKAAGACKSEFNRVLASQSMDELVTVICENLSWCIRNNVIDALPAGITSIGGYVYLRGYNHPLPSGITSII
jgi:hypothetical protein